jgi:uncharacterized protein (TIGR01777 family)
MRVLITGGTGFVGSFIVKKLIEKNHDVLLLTRNTENAIKKFGESVTAIEWKNYYEVLDLSLYGKIDSVINLMGENIGNKRWSNEQKKEIYNSRVDATDTIIKSLKKSNIRVESFISTSASGYYGSNNKTHDESSSAGEDYLSKVCQGWEEVVTVNKDEYDRFVILRVGMVLGKGGAMDKMLLPFKLGVGGKLGSGEQHISWIHVEDLVNMYIQVLEDKTAQGIYNAVATYSVTNSEFTKTLGKTLRKPTKFTVPKFVLNIALGEMSAVVLGNTKVIPKKFKAENFHYLYPTLELALKDVVSKI